MNRLVLLLVLVSQILSCSGPLSNIIEKDIHALGHVSENDERAFVTNKIGSGGQGLTLVLCTCMVAVDSTVECSFTALALCFIFNY